MHGGVIDQGPGGAGSDQGTFRSVLRARHRNSHNGKCLGIVKIDCFCSGYCGSRSDYVGDRTPMRRKSSWLTAKSVMP